MRADRGANCGAVGTTNWGSWTQRIRWGRLESAGESWLSACGLGRLLALLSLGFHLFLRA